MDFLEISPHDLECSNAFNMIGKEWFLICAADEERKCGANAMTASWGYLGNMWNKPSAVCFIRPQRYTYSLAERAERVSLCFFGEGERETFSYFGTKSGKDGDKAAACGLHYDYIDGVPYIREAKTVLICRKMYVDDLREECFTDKSIISSFYKAGDYHRIYACAIEKVLSAKCKVQS